SGVAGGPPANAASRLRGNQSGSGMGYSVASAGDVNGDGYADVIVGALDYDAPESNEGAAFVFLGSASGIVAEGTPANASARLESNEAGAFLGTSVASAGDVNGDGYADVIVGADHYSNGVTSQGGAFVFLGGPAGVASGNPSTAYARLQSLQASAGLGISV